MKAEQTVINARLTRLQLRRFRAAAKKQGATVSQALRTLIAAYTEGMTFVGQGPELTVKADGRAVKKAATQ